MTFAVETPCTVLAERHICPEEGCRVRFVAGSRRTAARDDPIRVSIAPENVPRGHAEAQRHAEWWARELKEAAE